MLPPTKPTESAAKPARMPAGLVVEVQSVHVDASVPFMVTVELPLQVSALRYARLGVTLSGARSSERVRSSALATKATPSGRTHGAPVKSKRSIAECPVRA